MNEPTQLSILNDAPDDPDIDDDPPDRPGAPIPPFGRLQLPVGLAPCDEQAERLFDIIEEARERTREKDIFGQFVRAWWAALRRFEGGEPDYMAIVKSWDDPEVPELLAKGFAVLQEHFVHDGGFDDLLGRTFMLCRHEWGGCKDQEFTGWATARMMARQTLGDLEAERLEPGEPLRLHDPACGSGVLLLAAQSVIAERFGREALQHVECSGQDIDDLCVTMCRIQMRMTNLRWMVAFLGMTYEEVAQDG